MPAYQVKTPILQETTTILMKNLRMLVDHEIDPLQANAVSLNADVVRKNLESDLKLRLAAKSLREAEDGANTFELERKDFRDEDGPIDGVVGRHSGGGVPAHRGRGRPNNEA